MQKFEDMVIRVLEEKYYTYKMPTDKSKIMYDFYVLDYLKYIINQPSKNFRDLPSDLEQSVNDAIKNFYPALREELLDAVFYAICAEIRHLDAHENENKKIIEDSNKQFLKLFILWKRYKHYHTVDEYSQKNLLSLYEIEKPSSSIRPSKIEKYNHSKRNMSFKAANYAIEKANSTRLEFVKMCEYLYKEGKWNPSYGGEPWVGICKGWRMLYGADEIETTIKDLSFKNKKQYTQKTPMSVAIDHIYDLQHNTDTVFNKLKSYYNHKTGYRWIQEVLDDKANVKSYHHLLNKASGTVKTMAIPILYNKLGTTWEKEMGLTSPKNSDISPTNKNDNQSSTIKTISQNNKNNDIEEEPEEKIKVGDVVVYKTPATNYKPEMFISLVIKTISDYMITYDIYRNGYLHITDFEFEAKDFLKKLKKTYKDVSVLKTSKLSREFLKIQ